MPKKDIFKIALLSVVLSLLVTIFFGRFLTAEVSTFPLLSRWKLLSPQAPIVINNRQEVRVTDSGDIQNTINSVRPKISSVLEKNGSQVLFLGGAVNLTSDGLFLSLKEVVGSVKAESLFVKLDDGSVSPVLTITQDPVTDLVVLKTNLNGEAVANIVSSKNLATGQNITLLAQGFASVNSLTFQNSFVSLSQQNDPTQIQDSDLPRRTFEIQSTGKVLGQSAVNQNGEIVGLWNGSSIVGGDVINDFLSKYLNNQTAFSRPSFGFHYNYVNPIEQKVTGLVYGAKVVVTVTGGATQKAGLLPNDIITAVNGNSLDQNTSLEELLQNIKPTDTLQLTVQRGKDTINLTLIAGEIK